MDASSSSRNPADECNPFDVIFPISPINYYESLKSIAGLDLNDNGDVVDWAGRPAPVPCPRAKEEVPFRQWTSQENDFLKAWGPVVDKTPHKKRQSAWRQAEALLGTRSAGALKSHWTTLKTKAQQEGQELKAWVFSPPSCVNVERVSPGRKKLKRKASAVAQESGPEVKAEQEGRTKKLKRKASGIAEASGSGAKAEEDGGIKKRLKRYVESARDLLPRGFGGNAERRA